MSSSSHPSTGSPPPASLRPRRPRKPIIATSHPGGRHPGVELPPSWYRGTEPSVTIPSPLPAPGDKAAVREAVEQMCAAVREAAREAYARGEHPALIGGDHALAMGTLASRVAFVSKLPG